MKDRQCASPGLTVEGLGRITLDITRLKVFAETAGLHLGSSKQTDLTLRISEVASRLSLPRSQQLRSEQTDH